MASRSQVRGRTAVLVVVAALALVSVASLLYGRAPVRAAAGPLKSDSPAPDDASVIFGAVGDFDNKAPNYVDMVALAKRLGNRGGMFLLAAGDLGYTADEQTWCDAIKGAFNNTLVVAGNHDTTESGPGDINNDVVYCPFNIDAPPVAGPTYGYGKSYYFDYPKTNPLVRVIMITAGTSGTQVSGQSYAKGGAEYNWVVNAVNGGRSAGIPWVVVGLHKMCITVGSKTSCEMGQAIFDKVIDLKVDLILQGHDHTYQRSKQLALSANCTTVPAAGNFDADCVVAQGAQFTKGNGSIVVINGAGGRDLYNVRTDGSDKEIGYFDAVMGNNVNTEGKSNGHGTIVVTLNATTLTGATNFCPLGSGDATSGECPSKVPTTFSDNFSISSIATPRPPLSADFSFSPPSPGVGQTVTFTASVQGGTPPYSYAWQFSDGATDSGGTAIHVYAAAGSYVANLTATDAASATTHVSKTVVVFSPPPPGGPPVTTLSLVGRAGSNGWYVSSVTISLLAVSPGGLSVVSHYRLDGGSWQTYAFPFTVGSGRHVLEYRSVDVAGQTEVTVSASVKVDTSPPKINMSPMAAVLTLSQVPVSWIESDDVAGVVESDISVDESAFASVGTNRTTTLSLSDGTHVIRVRAIDSAGNEATAELTFRVDTNPFSPSGPYGGVPLYFLLYVIAVLIVALVWRRHRRARREARRAALRRSRSRQP